jgi:hypothetical protein
MSIELLKSSKHFADGRLECRLYLSGVDADNSLVPPTWNAHGVSVEARVFSYSLFGQRYRSLAYISYFASQV